MTMRRVSIGMVQGESGEMADQIQATVRRCRAIWIGVPHRLHQRVQCLGIGFFAMRKRVSTGIGAEAVQHEKIARQAVREE